jgi:thiamine pyrophosphokinase
MPTCKLCGQDAGDMANICIQCGAKGDASGWMRMNMIVPKDYFIGDLSSLTQEERQLYMQTFDKFVAKSLKKVTEKEKEKISVQQELGYGN